MRSKKNNFDIEIKNIGKLFKDKFYTISDFQRSYAWEKEQQDDIVKDMVNNLKSTKDGKHYEYLSQEYFLGDIILRKKDDNNLDIVDGQQRLITLMILLVGIRNKLKKIADNGRNNKDSIHQSEKLIYDIEEYFYKTKGSEKFPIIKLSKKKERDFFYENILPYTNREDSNIPESDQDISKYSNALFVIEDRLEFYLEKKGTSLEKFTFLKAIYSQVIESKVITIILEEEKLAYTIYSNINSKGKHLSSIDLIKNDFLYKTRNIDNTPGIDKALNLWNEIYDNVKRNTSVSFSEFYKYGWYTIYPKDVFEYFDNKTSLFEIFQERFPSEKEARKIFDFFKELKKLSEYINDFSIPNNINEWKRDKWPIYVEKLQFLSNIEKDGESNKYKLWLLPIHYRFKKSKKDILLKELQKRITFVADILWLYNQLKLKLPKGNESIENIQKFFDRVFKESATFENGDYERESLEELKEQFMSNIGNKEELINILSSQLSYSKYSDNSEDGPYIRRLLIRINETKGNHLINYKLSIEHIKEDEDGGIASKIGNMVLLEQDLNQEANGIKIKNKDDAEQLLSKKFESIYTKSKIPEVRFLIDDVNHIDFNETYIKKRSKKIIEKYLEYAFNFKSEKDK